jgi:Cysteine-rich secretory protein family
MATALRCLTIIAAIVLLALLLTPTLYAATPQASAADITLLNAANRDRAAAGLPSLQWDPALAAAAHQHALRMAQMNTLSHQFPGEPPMQDRARQAGARFSLIAENVAEGPSVTGLHTQWMNSPPHRANLLDPELNSVGISAVQSGNMLFAVEDFSAAVPALALDAQEQQVESQLIAHGLNAVSSTADARKTCELDRGWAGQRPATVLRYETADLRQLPNEIEPKVASGKYRAAAVGACEASGSSGFSRFRIAILLY